MTVEGSWGKVAGGYGDDFLQRIQELLSMGSFEQALLDLWMELNSMLQKTSQKMRVIQKRKMRWKRQ